MKPIITLRPYTEEEYHVFFRDYQPDPRMDPTPYVYDREQISRSYRYQYNGFQPNYAHYGIFLNDRPVGAFQLKRIDPEKLKCEFGIILQNEAVRNQGIGTEAIRLGLMEAERFGLETVEGDTRSGNHRMKRVFEKLGFSLVECVPRAFQSSEGAEDRLVYRIQLNQRDRFSD